MAHMRFEGPRAQDSDDLFKLVDAGGEKKRRFSSFFKKPKIGKRAAKKDFEHLPLEGPSYSLDSNENGDEDRDPSDFDEWENEGRDEVDIQFDSIATRQSEHTREQAGFPPLPPQGSSKQANMLDNNDSLRALQRRQLNPTVVLSRTPKKIAHGKKPKDFSLSQVISQSFDSENGSANSGLYRDKSNDDSERFSFADDPDDVVMGEHAEYAQLTPSGEMTRVKGAFGNMHPSISPSSNWSEVDNGDLEETKIMEEIGINNDMLDHSSEQEKLSATQSGENLQQEKGGIDSSLPSFKDRLKFYKNQSSRKLAPWEVKAIEAEAATVEGKTFVGKRNSTPKSQTLREVQTNKQIPSPMRKRGSFGTASYHSRTGSYSEGTVVAGDEKFKRDSNGTNIPSYVLRSPKHVEGPSSGKRSENENLTFGEHLQTAPLSVSDRIKKLHSKFGGKVAQDPDFKAEAAATTQSNHSRKSSLSRFPSLGNIKPNGLPPREEANMAVVHPVVFNKSIVEQAHAGQKTCSVPESPKVKGQQNTGVTHWGRSPFLKNKVPTLAERKAAFLGDNSKIIDNERKPSSHNQSQRTSFSQGRASCRPAPARSQPAPSWLHARESLSRVSMSCSSDHDAEAGPTLSSNANRSESKTSEALMRAKPRNKNARPIDGSKSVISPVDLNLQSSKCDSLMQKEGENQSSNGGANEGVTSGRVLTLSERKRSLGLSFSQASKAPLEAKARKEMSPENEPATDEEVPADVDTSDEETSEKEVIEQNQEMNIEITDTVGGVVLTLDQRKKALALNLSRSKKEELSSFSGSLLDKRKAKLRQHGSSLQVTQTSDLTTIEDPSLASTRLDGGTNHVGSDCDHPLYVTISTNDRDWASHSPLPQDRRVVCVPGEGTSYYESLNRNPGSDLNEEVNSTSASNDNSNKRPPTKSEVSLVSLMKEEEKSSAETYKALKNRFSKKALPWRQQNAAGRYLERKRLDVSESDSENIPVDCPCHVKTLAPQKSEMFYPISKSPLNSDSSDTSEEPVTAKTPSVGGDPLQTPTVGANPLLLGSPFGTPANGYDYSQ